MDDAAATHLAGLKRKHAALKEAGATDRATEIAGQIKLAEDADPLPSAPRTIPSPKEETPKVKDTPQHADHAPQVRRGKAHAS